MTHLTMKLNARDYFKQIDKIGTKSFLDWSKRLGFVWILTKKYFKFPTNFDSETSSGNKNISDHKIARTRDLSVNDAKGGLCHTYSFFIIQASC